MGKRGFSNLTDEEEEFTFRRICGKVETWEGVREIESRLSVHDHFDNYKKRTMKDFDIRFLIQELARLQERYECLSIRLRMVTEGDD